jgi:exo-1,4-beta-D-glucosaminidase
LKNDYFTSLQQTQWADMTALSTMVPAAIDVEARQTGVGPERRVLIRLRNPSEHIAFFERATLSVEREGPEVLPIQYDDNYVTVYPGETVEIQGIVPKNQRPRWVTVGGWNTPTVSAPIRNVDLSAKERE